MRTLREEAGRRTAFDHKLEDTPKNVMYRKQHPLTFKQRSWQGYATGAKAGLWPLKALVNPNLKRSYSINVLARRSLMGCAR